MSLHSAVPRALLAFVLALASYALVPHPGYFSPRYGVVRFIDGSAHNPFARRALAPWLVQATRALLPAGARSRLDHAVESRLKPPPTDPPVAPGYGSALAISIGWSLLELAAFYFLVGEIAASALGGWSAALIPALAAGLWSMFTSFSVFIYDPLVLVLWAAAALAIARERKGAIDALVILCALTKESALALPLAAWHAGPSAGRGRRFVLRTLAVVILQACLFLAFRGRPGDVLEGHFRENVATAIQLPRWFQVEPFGVTVGFPRGLPFSRPVGFNLAVWVPVLTLTAYGWRTAPRSLRWATGVLATLALPLQATVCMLHEIRDLYELWPFVLWMMALGLSRLARSARDGLGVARAEPA